MRKITKYRCEFCGRELKNKLEMEKHEPICKETTTTAQTAEKRIKALFEQLHKNGYFVSVHWNGAQKHIIVVYDPTHKYDD